MQRILGCAPPVGFSCLHFVRGLAHLRSQGLNADQQLQRHFASTKPVYVSDDGACQAHQWPHLPSNSLWVVVDGVNELQVEAPIRPCQQV
jgi:hypothetical protein